MLPISMNVRDYYEYLVAARKQLLDFLRALPEQELNTPLLEADRFQNIKDFLVHIMDTEAHWLHAVALQDGALAQQYPHNWVRPQAEQYPLGWITEYGQAVQGRTLAFLDTPPDLSRRIRLIQDDPQSHEVTLEQLLWHVMTHEVRHSAQVALLIRLLGHTPPWLDYLRFMRPQ